MAVSETETTESTNIHIVEIPVIDYDNPNPIDNHPLTEISHSPGHLLLLNLHQRAESQLTHRISFKETQVDNLKREAFYLSSLFFAFHALSFTLTFTFTFTNSSSPTTSAMCNRWWVPCLLSTLTSCVLIASVQVRVCGYWRVMREVMREREDGRAMRRFVQELRMKGASFDLGKEMVVKEEEEEEEEVEKRKWKRRRRNSSVENLDWGVVRVFKENFVTICLVGFAGLIVPASKFALCA